MVTTIYYRTKKLIEYLFFRFLMKIITLMPVFNRNRPFFKKHTALMPIFCQKTAFIPKTRCSHVIFFQVFHEKPSAVMPIFGQKNVTPAKKHYFMDQKSQLDGLLSHCSRKSMLLCPYFIKTTSILSKTQCSEAHILSKKPPFSDKHCALI